MNPFPRSTRSRARRLQDEIARIWQADETSRKTIVLITNDVRRRHHACRPDHSAERRAGGDARALIHREHPRPRDRKALNHDPRFKDIRRELTAFLLGSRRERQPARSTPLVLPDIEPEDPSRSARTFSWRARRDPGHEIKPKPWRSE